MWYYLMLKRAGYLFRRVTVNKTFMNNGTLWLYSDVKYAFCSAQTALNHFLVLWNQILLVEYNWRMCHKLGEFEMVRSNYPPLARARKLCPACLVDRWWWWWWTELKYRANLVSDVSRAEVGTKNNTHSSNFTLTSCLCIIILIIPNWPQEI